MRARKESSQDANSNENLFIIFNKPLLTAPINENAVINELQL